MRRLLALRAEILTAIAWLAGWALLTIAVAEIAPPRVVWPASVGLLCFALGGFRLVGYIAMTGLYLLTREDDDG